MKSRALVYALRSQYSLTSGASGIGCGLRTELRFPEGTEASRGTGARHDSPEWFRKWHIFYQQFVVGDSVSRGMLRNDRLMDQGWQGYPARCRGRFTDQQMKAFVMRKNRTDTCQANGGYQLPDAHQPNIDADHHFMDVQYGSQIKCEYEEKNLVDTVCGGYIDFHHRFRSYWWFHGTRIMQIWKHKQNLSGDVTVNTETGQLERNDCIGGSFSRSAF